MATDPAQRPTCHWTRFRCYAPSVAFMAVIAVLIALVTWELRGRSIDRIYARHYVHGLLLWFVLSPVLLGILRGVRRSRRHITHAR